MAPRSHIKKLVITFCRKKDKNSVMLSESADSHIDGFKDLKDFFENISIFGQDEAVKMLGRKLPEDVE